MDNLVFYEKYNKLMPAWQVKLLQLWDKLGIPHEEDKQLFGLQLNIIGFHIDADEMSIMMPADAQKSLDDTITHFVAGHHPTQTLCACQQLARHINWALNVTPCLCLGLASLYAKMFATPKT